MKKLLLTSFGLLTLQHSYGQDSSAAIYINEHIEKIEERIQILILEKKDTTIYYEDSLKNIPLRIRTEFYTNPQTMQVEKIIEKSSFKTLATEIIVYFRFNQPVKLTTVQKEGTRIKADFDVYYVNNHSIHFTQRTTGKGKPDEDELLVWCKELLKEYDKMVASQKESGIMPVPGTNKKGLFLFKKKKSG